MSNPEHRVLETEVDGREWAVQHLTVALETEAIDEKDFHVSLAVQLLTEEAGEASSPDRPSPN